MSTLLLMVIYAAFIGLGLPDSLFGAVWPAIYKDINLPFSWGSIVTAIIYCGTMVSSILSARLLRRFGTYRITAFCTTLTAVALLGFSRSGSFLFLCLFAIPLGLGAGSIDTALNNYVALHYSPKHMNYLHCFYGIGVVVSPWIISRVLASGSPWQNGYRFAFFIQAFLALFVAFSWRAWKRTGDENEEAGDEGIQVLSLHEIIRTPGVILVWIMIIGDSAVESICNTWGATYLVEQKGFSAEIAAGIAMFYFLGMTCGRFTAGLVSEKMGSWRIIFISLPILALALVMLILPGGRIAATLAYFLMGFGIGPVFPNISFLTPGIFGPKKSPSIMGTQMAVGSFALMILPIACGIIGRYVGMWIFPIIMLVFSVLLFLASIRLYTSSEKKR